jgi:hypothetical protein
MRRIALALLACTAWIATAAAMDEPAPSAQDSRIPTASYSPDNFLHITSTDLNPVQIVLQYREVVDLPPSARPAVPGWPELPKQNSSA